MKQLLIFLFTFCIMWFLGNTPSYGVCYDPGITHCTNSTCTKDGIAYCCTTGPDECSRTCESLGYCTKGQPCTTNDVNIPVGTCGGNANLGLNCGNTCLPIQLTPSPTPGCSCNSNNSSSCGANRVCIQVPGKPSGCGSCKSLPASAGSFSCNCQIGQAGMWYCTRSGNCGSGFTYDTSRCPAGAVGSNPCGVDNCSMSCVPGKLPDQEGDTCLNNTCANGFYCDPATNKCVAIVTAPPYPPFNPCTFSSEAGNCNDCINNKKGVWTALGCIPSNSNELIVGLIKFAMGMAGGIAFLIMLYGTFVIITASGNPEKVAGGQQTITAAVMGLVTIIFAAVILNIIGVQIIQIPGL